MKWFIYMLITIAVASLSFVICCFAADASDRADTFLKEKLYLVCAVMTAFTGGSACIMGNIFLCKWCGLLLK